MATKTYQKNTMYTPFMNSKNLKTEVYDFIDKFISNMESSTKISLAEWLHPNLNRTFYSLLEQIGYAGWSYSFDSPGARQIFSVQAELKDEDKEPTSYDTYRIVSITENSSDFFIKGENYADFFDITKYLTYMAVLNKNMMDEPFKENIDALIFQLSYPKREHFNQGDIIDLYGLYFNYNTFDIENLNILKYFIDQELTILRNEKIISKKQKKKAKESDPFQLTASKKLFKRIKNNMSALSSKATSSPETLFPECLTQS